MLFPTDDANLTPQARAVLARQADWLTGNPNWRAVIEGHAAENGTREYNLSLGARRASSVQDYLIAHGVDPDRLRTVSFGKERPLQACATEACHAANRRAVTTLHPAGMI
ncbi:OmpA family protein [Paracoccus jiaweipingae]|uniref:OmpA family protein n=1 Tax=unclassified Paracoccus (in: a-proteobacteria) TaxID=2688777 RepID=UPI0037AEE5E1